MKYRKPDWAVNQIILSNGKVFDICKCAARHPNEDWVKERDPDGTRYLITHVCCGCCVEDKNEN